jgi:hypothetical protein
LTTVTGARHRSLVGSTLGGDDVGWIERLAIDVDVMLGGEMASEAAAAS